MELLQFNTLLYSTLDELSVESEAPAALPLEQMHPYLLDRWLGAGCGGSHKALLETSEKGKVLSATDIQRTIARLSSHYRSYCTNWAIRINTYEFISLLLRMFISCWFGVKTDWKKRYFFDFICSLQQSYVILNASGAAALTGRCNVRGLSKADCRAGKEKFCHLYTMQDIEIGEDKLTVRTVRLKLLTGPFRLGHLM
jgi:hypothetical protein